MVPATTTIPMLQQIVSSSGQIITDTVDIWIFVIGICLAGFFLGGVLWTFRWAMKKLFK